MTKTLYVDLLEAALAYAGGTHTVEDVQRGVLKGEYQLWEGQRSIIVTELHDTPQKRELVFFLAAGDMAEVRQLYDIVLAWGRECGCDRACFVGRKGWERTFLTRDEGWTPTHVVYSKELTNG
jgi:hypothetical protein